jgi:hypothetical protein
MTIKELEQSGKDVLTPAEIAPILGSDPQTIRWQAHNQPDKLGFPVIVVKSRVKIPRLGFIRFCVGEARDKDTKGGMTSWQPPE